MNKEEFLSKRYAIDLKLKELNEEREQMEKEYIESNQGFPVGSKVCITVMVHKRNNERILVPEAKKLAYIADYEIDDNGEVVHTFFWFSIYFLTVSSDMRPTDSTK